MARLGTATLEAGFNSPASLQELKETVVQALKEWSCKSEGSALKLFPWDRRPRAPDCLRWPTS